MAKKRKQAAVWQGFLWGGLLSLGIYLLGLLLLALLLVRGTLSEGFPAVAVLCTAAAMGGGLLAVWRTGWGAGGLLTGAAFAGVLILGGLLFWEELTWTGSGGILLLCALGGGFLATLASLTGLTKRQRKRRK
ncbi:hypothetical protein [uncultured Oscillibacter sp.]|uniref:hypothetical protein n=1 Tax=uncultured Oscillibacter sp. TaxID=876091 RepID=UPI00263359E6|nr:hypothetical protein [uncultured Oscillibacter sp.]